jgi:hypothetical protein
VLLDLAEVASARGALDEADQALDEVAHTLRERPLELCEVELVRARIAGARGEQGRAHALRTGVAARALALGLPPSAPLRRA